MGTKRQTKKLPKKLDLTTGSTATRRSARGAKGISKQPCDGTQEVSKHVTRACLNELTANAITELNHEQEVVEVLQIEDSLENIADVRVLTNGTDKLSYVDVVSFEEQEDIKTPSKSLMMSSAECIPKSSLNNVSRHSVESDGILRTEQMCNGELPVATSSDFHGNLKLHRFIMCEWFYSHIDRSLFEDKYSEIVCFDKLLRDYYPALHKCALNRAQWNYIRGEFAKIRPVRRFSPAFLRKERHHLETRREKVRFLTDDPSVIREYSDRDIPSVLPRRFRVGDMVKAILFTPYYGSFRGEVLEVEEEGDVVCRIRFPIEGMLQEQFVKDYCVALDVSSPSSPEPPDVLSVSVKHLKQVALLKESLDKKQCLLYELDSIRLNVLARRVTQNVVANGEEDLSAVRYREIIRMLLDINRTLQSLYKHVVTDYEQYMDMPLTTGSDPPAVESCVIEVANQLREAYSDLDNMYNHPVADQLWSEAMKRLQKKPDYMRQFEYHLRTTVGTKFIPSAYIDRLSEFQFNDF